MIKFFKWFIGLGSLISVLLLALYCVLCISFPIKHLDIINRYCEMYNLRPSFVCAIINTESRFNEDVTSHKGALGLMQLMPSTIDWAAEQIPIENFSYADVTEPETNIRLGCWVLGYLSEQFDGNEELMAAAYNAGIGNVKKWLGNTKYSRDGEYLHYIPYNETANYVEKVRYYDKIYSVLLMNNVFEQRAANEND